MDRIGRSVGGVVVKSTSDTKRVTGPPPPDVSRISTWLLVPKNMYRDDPDPSVWWNTDPVGPVAVIPAAVLVTVWVPRVVVGAADQASSALLLNRPLEMTIGSAALAGADPSMGIAPAAPVATSTA